MFSFDGRFFVSDHETSSSPHRGALRTRATQARGELDELISSLCGDHPVTSDYCWGLAARLRVLAKDVDRFAARCSPAPPASDRIWVYPGQAR